MSGRVARACPSWADLSAALHEGASEVSLHLEECPTCRERCDLLIGLSTWLPRRGLDGDAALCPDVTSWLRLAGDEMGALQRRQLVGHLASCPECAVLWRELLQHVDETDDSVELELHEGFDEPSFGEGDLAGPVVERGTTRGVAGGIAAAVLGAVLLALLLASPFPPVGSGAADRWRGPAPLIETSVAWTAGQSGPTLSWVEVPAVSAYRVRVWKEEGDLLLDRYVPPATRGWDLEGIGLAAGDVVVWSVDAIRDGDVVATSTPARIDWRDP